MMDRIEKMARMRKVILLEILIGSVIAFCLILFPAIFSIFHGGSIPIIEWKNHLFYCAAFIWLFTLIIFIVIYALFKRNLKKDPSLNSAVYDERAKTNWLKACRFAFFVLVGLTIVVKSCDMFLSRPLLEMRFTLPNGPFFVLWGAVIALIGSFLFYNREAENE